MELRRQPAERAAGEPAADATLTELTVLHGGDSTKEDTTAADEARRVTGAASVRTGGRRPRAAFFLQSWSSIAVWGQTPHGAAKEAGGLPGTCGQSAAIGGQAQPNRKAAPTYIHVLLNIKLAGGQ